MAKDQKKKQEKVLKRRRKKKAADKKRHETKIAATPRGLVKRAHNFPIRECLINDGWDQETNQGFARIVITREQPDGLLIAGTYLVDLLCLGVKDTHFIANLHPKTYYDEVLEKMYFDVSYGNCAPELAHQIIYAAIDYAGQFGFKPHKDFKLSRNMLDKRGTYPEEHEIEFGRDGKPLYISGPYDNTKSIVAKLEKNAGAGNYEYVAQVTPFFDDDLFDDEEDDFDEDDFDEDED